ncbi:3-hydroxyacyl-CoA dehydrogenase NAD-binding domain-containing protein [Kutzneria viridogrisea]|uniref:L-gulonate 3-dehydrogenase n=1 Tax=Kutzneria viridogrisea TaxID=47990 RepID=A0ABR6BP94_9PSEU|nr:ketoreductase RED1 [Kutzneria viridogrisea]
MKIAIIGAGTIGLSWATLFLSRGHTVTVSDPRPDLAQVVPRGALLAESVEQAVAEAEVVQENGPERIEFKQDLFAAIEKAAPSDALILSSTSGLVASAMSEKMAEPGRLIVGHPFNPPHILPLVELVPSPATPDALVRRAREFYRSLGKVPVLVHKEVDGFVANRLQHVLFRECVSLVEQGVVSVAELDEIVTNSVGVRWATVGPFQAFHLGGGPGGLRHMMAHLMTDIEPETAARLAEAAEREYPLENYEQLCEMRDRLQSAIIELKGGVN